MSSAVVRQRIIAGHYLTSAKARLDLLVSQNNDSLNELIAAQTSFLYYLNKWELAQNEVEVQISDDELGEECARSHEFRVKMSTANHEFEDFIRQKTSAQSLNPFHNIVFPDPTVNSIHNESNVSDNVSVYSSVTHPDVNNQNANGNNNQTLVVTNQNLPQPNFTNFVNPINQNLNHNPNFITPIMGLNNLGPQLVSTGISQISPNSNIVVPLTQANVQNITNVPVLSSSVQTSAHIPTNNVNSNQSSDQNSFFSLPNLPINQASTPINIPILQASVPNDPTTIPIYSLNSPHDTQISKLDKVKLQLFSGKVESWQSFWEIFESLVHNTNLPIITKFTYLKGCLRGEALKCIEGFAITATNYPIVVERLKKRYGRKDLIIQSHIQALLTKISVKVVPSADLTKYIAALWDFTDTICVHVRSLSALGIEGRDIEHFLCPIILSKIPNEIRLEWFKVPRVAGNLELLLTFLDDYITTLSQSNFSASQTSSSPNSSSKVKKQGSSVM